MHQSYWSVHNTFLYWHCAEGQMILMWHTDPDWCCWLYLLCWWSRVYNINNLCVCFAGMGAEERHIKRRPLSSGLLSFLFFFLKKLCIYLFKTSSSPRASHSREPKTSCCFYCAVSTIVPLSMLTVLSCATRVVRCSLFKQPPFFFLSFHSNLSQQIDSLGSKGSKVKTKYLFVNV